LGGGRLALVTCSSPSSGSNASLEGTGVKVEAVVPLFDFGRLFDGAGVEAGTMDRGLGAAGELVEGVFWKKPKRVFCPPEEEDFFNPGVVAGVEVVFRGILIVRLVMDERQSTM
jgi:hypothetical protein